MKCKAKGLIEVESAGTRAASEVSSMAKTVMGEKGLVMDGQFPKSIESIEGPYEVVVTTCDNAARECAFFAGTLRTEHWSIPDPADAVGTDEEKLHTFRKTRDELEHRIDALLKSLNRLANA